MRAMAFAIRSPRASVDSPGSGPIGSSMASVTVENGSGTWMRSQVRPGNQRRSGTTRVGNATAFFTCCATMPTLRCTSLRGPRGPSTARRTAARRSSSSRSSASAAPALVDVALAARSPRRDHAAKLQARHEQVAIRRAGHHDRETVALLVVHEHGGDLVGVQQGVDVRRALGAEPRSLIAGHPVAARTTPDQEDDPPTHPIQRFAHFMTVPSYYRAPASSGSLPAAPPHRWNPVPGRARIRPAGDACRDRSGPTVERAWYPAAVVRVVPVVPHDEVSVGLDDRS
jgi:hypothetical protein